MGTVVRLLLVRHATTEALLAARFPVDEPLTDSGRAAAQRLARLSAPSALVAPERRTRETASALGLEGRVEPVLRDLDAGEWAGRRLDSVAPDEVTAWLTDPTFRPPGGEAIVDLVARIAWWLATVATAGVDTLAVTHPAVVRAVVLSALDAPGQSLWRLDVPPLSVTRLHHRGAWTLRSFGYDSPRLTP
ncbi:MAG TPA: histidine phosphatase family protein [Aldersonia sp.]